MGGSINTYYSGSLLKRLTTVAPREYPNDERAVKKVIVEAVELLVSALENKHHINPDGATKEERAKEKERSKKKVKPNE